MNMIGSMELLLIMSYLILGALFFVLWLWMPIDCLKRPDDTFEIGGTNAKIIWIMVIIFTGCIGALRYFFLIKKKTYLIDEKNSIDQLS